MEDSAFYYIFTEKFDKLIKQSGIKVTQPTQTIIEESIAFMRKALPLTRRQFSVADFYCVDASFNQATLEHKVLEMFANTKVFDCEELCNLLFFYIKKRKDVMDLINSAKRVLPDFKMSIIRLIEYLLSHSDENLKTLIVISTSLYSATPLFSINFDSPNPVVWEDHFVVFEGHQSILNFKLPERGFKGPKGTTSLINLLMSRSFELHSDTYSSFGTVEIQYDYNFAE